MELIIGINIIFFICTSIQLAKLFYKLVILSCFFVLVTGILVACNHGQKYILLCILGTGAECVMNIHKLFYTYSRLLSSTTRKQSGFVVFCLSLGFF